MDPHKLLTRDQLAELWQIDKRHLDRLIKDGDLRAVKIGRAVRIAPADAELFMQENSTLRPGKGGE